MPNFFAGGDVYNDNSDPRDAVQHILACELRTNLNIWTH